MATHPTPAPSRPAWNARYLVPNAVTAANISAGFCSLLAAADGRYESAVYLLVLAIVLDLCDGRIARYLGATSRFGQQLDSFSDSLSSGAAPAFLVYRAVLMPLHGWGVAVSLVYLLAGVGRLARFNLTTDAHTKARRTVGLPIPVAGGYMMALTLMRDRVNLTWAVVIVLVLAILMVSRLALPEFRASGWLGAAFMVGLATYLAVVWRPSWTTVALWNGWNLVILAVAWLVQPRAPDTGSAVAQGA
jgi:CDP-diacylglycerol---serine O-phosphatidyltransferase